MENSWEVVRKDSRIKQLGCQGKQKKRRIDGKERGIPGRGKLCAQPESEAFLFEILLTFLMGFYNKRIQNS
jgi:hypothetical protein